MAGMHQRTNSPPKEEEPAIDVTPSIEVTIGRETPMPRSSPRHPQGSTRRRSRSPGRSGRVGHHCEPDLLTTAVLRRGSSSRGRTELAWRRARYPNGAISVRP
jgi:hypothetical protein